MGSREHVLGEPADHQIALQLLTRFFDELQAKAGEISGALAEQRMRDGSRLVRLCEAAARERAPAVCEAAGLGNGSH